jgi:hypothetical protein
MTDDWTDRIRGLTSGTMTISGEWTDPGRELFDMIAGHGAMAFKGTFVNDMVPEQLDAMVGSPFDITYADDRPALRFTVVGWQDGSDGDRSLLIKPAD